MITMPMTITTGFFFRGGVGNYNYADDDSYWFLGGGGGAMRC